MYLYFDVKVYSVHKWNNIKGRTKRERIIPSKQDLWGYWGVARTLFESTFRDNAKASAHYGECRFADKGEFGMCTGSSHGKSGPSRSRWDWTGREGDVWPK